MLGYETSIQCSFQQTHMIGYRHYKAVSAPQRAIMDARLGCWKVRLSHIHVRSSLDPSKQLVCAFRNDVLLKSTRLERYLRFLDLADLKLAAALRRAHHHR